MVHAPRTVSQTAKERGTHPRNHRVRYAQNASVFHISFQNVRWEALVYFCTGQNVPILKWFITIDWLTYFTVWMQGSGAIVNSQRHPHHRLISQEGMLFLVIKSTHILQCFDSETTPTEERVSIRILCWVYNTLLLSPHRNQHDLLLYSLCRFRVTQSHPSAEKPRHFLYSFHGVILRREHEILTLLISGWCAY